MLEEMVWSRGNTGEIWIRQEYRQYQIRLILNGGKKSWADADAYRKNIDEGGVAKLLVKLLI